MFIYLKKFCVKYFINSTVYCFDINISNFVYSSKKVIVYGLDVNNKSKLKKILEKINLESDSNYFDIIISDSETFLKYRNALSNIAK